MMDDEVQRRTIRSFIFVKKTIQSIGLVKEALYKLKTPR